METITTSLLIAGAIQGALLSLFLFSHKKGNKTANTTLAAALALFSISIACHAISLLLTVENDTHDSHIIMSGAAYMFSPLIYIYTAFITGRKKRYIPADLVHLLFVVWIALVYIMSLILTAHNVTFGRHHILYSAVYFFFPFQIIVYSILTLRLLAGHYRRIRENFSETGRITLYWIGAILLLNVATWLSGSVMDTCFPRNDRVWDYIWLFVAVYLYILAYFALKQQPVLFVSGDSAEREKYRNYKLTASQSDSIKANLDRALYENKIYLTEGLTLASLACELEVPPYLLSQVINDRCGMNFFELINSERVNEAARIIRENDLSSIAETAFAVGFNSLSAFNSAFRKFKSMTPTEFRKRRSRGAQHDA